MKKSKLKLSTTHIILFSFLIAVLVGAVLLSLPISSATGEWTPFVDALFTSTTATCVTGLVVVPTFSAWSTFGHIIILFLIQIGGLGVITVVSLLAMMFHKKWDFQTDFFCRMLLILIHFQVFPDLLKRLF